jgi:hypothetical protein
MFFAEPYASAADVACDQKTDGTTGKYADHCVQMLLREDHPRRPGRAGTLIFGQEFKGQDYFRQTPILTEVMPITGNYMMMSGFPKELKHRVYTMRDGHKGGPFPKYNMKADKLMIFVGSDPEHMNDLGAHVEFHLGEGKDEAVFQFDEPRAIFVPKGVRHGPIYITHFRRNLTMFAVFTQPSKEASEIVQDFDYAGDDTKIHEVIGDQMDEYLKFYSEDPK